MFSDPTLKARVNTAFEQDAPAQVTTPAAAKLPQRSGFLWV